MITRLHSHPGPLCRFLFSCSMPSSPPIPSTPSFYTPSAPTSVSPATSSPPSPAIFLSPPASFCPSRLAPISPWKSYPLTYGLHLYARKKPSSERACSLLREFRCPFDSSAGSRDPRSSRDERVDSVESSRGTSFRPEETRRAGEMKGPHSSRVSGSRRKTGQR